MSVIDFNAVTLDVRFGHRRVRVLSDASFSLPRRQMCLVAESRLGTVSVLDLMCRRLVPQQGSLRFAGRVSWPIGHAAPFAAAVTGMQAVSHLSTLYDFDRDLALEFIHSDFEAPALLVRPMASWPRLLQTQFMLLLALVPDFDLYLVDGNLVLPEDVAFTRRFLPMFLARSKDRALVMTARQVRLVQTLCDSAVMLRNGKLELTEDLTSALAFNNRLPSLSDPIRSVPEPEEEDLDPI